MASSFENVAGEFVRLYYQYFDTNRALLQGLYRDGSMLTFESTSILGAAAITEKLQVHHEIGTTDAQPSVNGGVLVLVTGRLLVDDEERPMNFTQVFHLQQDANGYFVYNDVFKLMFG